jgi:hypothetical protein
MISEKSLNLCQWDSDPYFSAGLDPDTEEPDQCGSRSED